MGIKKHQHRRCWLVLLIGIGMLQQAKPQYSYTPFNTYSGLSQAANYFMLKDSMGYLWVASQDGLNRFDGRTFTNFYYLPTDSNSLFGNSINNLIEHTKGSMFVASTKGLCQYNYATHLFSAIDIFNKKDSVEQDTYLLYKYKDTLFVIDDINGCYGINLTTRRLLWQDTTMRVPRQFSGTLQITYLPQQHAVAMATPSGMVIYSRLTRHTTFISFTNPLFASRQITKIFTVANGGNTLGIGTNNGLLLLDAATLTVLYHTKLPNPARSTIFSLKKETDGTWLIGGNDTCLYTMQAGMLQKMPLRFKQSGYQLNNISCLYTTPYNIFINEDTKGIGAISRQPKGIKSHTALNNPVLRKSSPNIHCFAEDGLGRIWLGKRGGGLLLYYPATGNIEPFANLYHQALPILLVHALQYHEGSIYIGTENGIYRYHLASQKLSKLALPAKYAAYNEAAWCNHFTVLANGRLLAGTRESIFLVNEQTDSLQPMGSGRFYAYYLYQNHRGQLVTTGLGSNLEVYDIVADTLRLAGSYLSQFSIKGIWQNPANHHYWLACIEGIVHTDSNYHMLRYYNHTNGLRCNTFYGIVPDNSGNIWSPSNKGIATINLQTGVPHYYFTNDEISGLEYNGKGFFASANGTLYFGSEQGFDEVIPQLATQPNTSPYIIQAEQLMINEQPAPANLYTQLANSHITLQPDQHSLAMQVNAVNCESDIAPHIYYTVDGLQQQWSEIAPYGWIRLPQLAPGHYTLRLRLESGLPHQQVAIALTVQPAFYQTVWFKVLACLILAALLYCLYGFRVRQLKRILGIRQKISADLHDDIGSTLSTINLYSQQPGSLHNIQENTLDALDRLDDIVWATNPKNDHLKNLVDRIDSFARTILHTKNIRFVLQADDNLELQKISEETRKNLYLICKEAINNTAKYSQCTTCTLVLYKKSRLLCCTITDDGIGFDPKLPTNRNGLLNMRLRAEAVKGTLRIESGAGNGTTITAMLPF